MSRGAVSPLPSEERAIPARRSRAVDEPGRVSPPLGKRLAREVKAIKSRLGVVEGQIHELEARLAEIGRLLADPGLYRDGVRAREIAQSRKATEERVAGLMKEWEGLSVQLSSTLGER